MDRRQYAETLREHAKLTRKLADKAETEGNSQLARELVQLAKDTEMKAMSTWPIVLHKGDEAPEKSDVADADTVPAIPMSKGPVLVSTAQS